jgi:hypothetical protein
MKQWQKEVLEITKDEPTGGIFSEKIKSDLRESGFKVKELKKKKHENTGR